MSLLLPVVTLCSEVKISSGALPLSEEFEGLESSEVSFWELGIFVKLDEVLC